MKHIRTVFFIVLLSVTVCGVSCGKSDPSAVSNPAADPTKEAVSEAVTELILSSPDELPDIETLKAMPSLKRIDLSAAPAVSYPEIEQFVEALPDCRILWNQPLSNGVFRSDSTELVLPHATAEDIDLLRAFSDLQSVDASGSTAYAALADFSRRCPNIDVRYTIDLNGVLVSSSDTEIAVPAAAEAKPLIDALVYFPAIRTIDLHDSGWTDSEILDLHAACPQAEIDCVFRSAGLSLDTSDEKIDLRGASDLTPDTVLQMLSCMHGPKAIALPQNWEAHDIETIRSAYPLLQIAEPFTAFDRSFDGAAEEADVSGIAFASVDDVEAFADRLPFLNKLVMCECGLSNEQMETLTERRPAIRFVWTIEIGKRKLRTDARGFSTLNPSKYQNPKATKEYNEKVKKAVRLYEGDIEPLKYCTDLEALDLGHNYLTNEDLKWIAQLTKLKVLILADNKITDISALTTLKDLEYIELFMNRIPDLSPLCAMPSLVDVNVCNTGVSDLTPLFDLTGVSRLWYAMNPFDRKQAKELKETLSDCECNYTTNDETGDGWRENPRYRWMRSYFTGN